MASVHVFFNPISGKNKDKELLEQIKNSFMEKGFDEDEISFVFPTSPKDAFQQAKKASQNKVDYVIPIGGDGNINKIIAGVYEGGNQSKIGLIPSGTVNNFAKALAIPLTVEAAIDVIVHGRDQKVDICKVNDHYMISSLTLGLLADIATNVTPQAKRKFGPLAFAKDSFRILRRNRSYYLRLDDGKNILPIKTKFLLITMTNMIGGFPSFSPTALINDGLIQVYTMKKVSFFKFLFHINDFRKGDFSKAREITHFSTKQLTIEPLKIRTLMLPRTRVDGDKDDFVPVTLEVLHEAITVRVPRR
ncbi:diacylglycerol kinase [Streptococcus penaeicida]|uniref:Diacylglycerol kinase n=1 Tax=Streptococcus penaeicida TaxID=1765960 RepID=A0A2N8LCU3_9STRE|nr:diacylglycerol kinase family protein [Streptococcus penaeicida]PND47979.1 diacylglycerol kinase [Streptococcus penaeicida]